MTADSTLPGTTAIGRTALTVSDLDPMVEFYRDIVGLRVQRRDATEAVLGADQSALLVLERDADAPPRRREGAGLFHTAFRVPSRAALGAAIERIESDWTLTGASDHYVSEALYLDDPEGNGVEIYRDLPEPSWPRNGDGTIDIGTAPLDVDTIAAASDGAAVAPAETTVGHVHIEVTSIGAARDFYAGTLGLGVKTAAESALFLAAGRYHHHLGVNAWNRRSEPARGRGMAWFEFAVPDGSLAGIRDRIVDAGKSVTPLEEGFAVVDPDGIELRVRVEDADR